MRITRWTVIRGALFAGLVGLELYLARSMSNSPSIRAYVETKSYGVSSAQKGVVKRLAVALGQQVTAGQVIAELDATELDGQLDVERAERKRLIAEIRAGNEGETKLHAVDKKLELLAERREALRLKAPADGVIESVNVRVGDAVTAETPVATVVATDTRRVLACVPEQRIAEVEVGTSAEVTSVVGDVTMNGTVEALTPAIAELPARCQPIVAKPHAYGRIATILLDRPAPLLPGQSELVAFGATGAAPHPPEPARIEASPPTTIDVPEQLAAITRFEASGLTWVPSIDRFVVVSDETGSNGRHPPWLFTMSQRGVLDPEPLVIGDMSALDDAESIAAGAAGDLYVLASQSVSEHGKRPPARELLAHLVPDDVGFKADKTVQLLSILESANALAALGVGDARQLDIEGMAFHGGALYFGLKSPVDAQGRAMIWKAAAPDRLLAGDVAGAKLAPWSAVALTVDVDGKQVPAGIADMVFLSDTTLVVGATASGIDTKHQDGALFVIANGTATRIQTFHDLKPEGVALSPTPGRLTVMFDRGKQAPMWTEVELPHGDL